jgi:nitrite reductase/ring-hydroxylating ferredoxin subunit/uncharacterized membrane protein
MGRDRPSNESVGVAAMLSRARLKNHPIHPFLIPFPIAFGTGALAADLVGRLDNWPTVWATGAYLAVAAVATGLLAAVPGLIDYFSIVPPNSSAKQRATYHMLVNVLSITLIGIGAAFRDPETWRAGIGTVLCEAAGMACMTMGGWLGGTLVYRNQIGVDHRYARAGKWKEAHLDGRPGEQIVVATADELQPDQMKLLHVAGRRIVLARTDAGYVACDDRCTHKGGPLSDGVLACGTVQCPWHGSQFDVRTGEVKAGPAVQAIRTYAVTEDGGRVRLTVPGD